MEEKKNKTCKIGNALVGADAPVFIIAELSANHGQDIDVALKTVKAAKEAGADAIKLQHYMPQTITIDCNNSYFQISQGTIWDGATLYSLYQDAYMPWEWTAEIMKMAEDLGLECFSSPFDHSAVDFLEKHRVPAYKIASFEITDISLIRKVAATQKPVIISTGIADIPDIELALEACQMENNPNVILLKCTSSYPAPYESMNLLTIPDMQARFGKVVGLSDHSLGISVPVAAVALGAKVIEKHFILDKSLGGPDAAFSLDPTEFGAMVRAVRETELALGSPLYEMDEAKKKSRQFARSLFVVKDIKKGDILTEENVRSIRPGYGLHPKYYDEVLGKPAAKDIERGTPLSFDLIG